MKDPREDFLDRCHAEHCRRRGGIISVADWFRLDDQDEAYWLESEFAG